MNRENNAEWSTIHALKASDFSVRERMLDGLLQRCPLYENKKDGSLLVWVPGGKSIAGGPREIEGRGEFEVSLAGFYIGLHPITNRQYARFVAETQHRPPDKNDNSGGAIWNGGTYPEQAADHPVVCVSWKDAQAYCKWAGLRLPSELEWEKAARGTQGFDFPWGNQWDEHKCRNDARHSEGTCEVWAYGFGASPWGTYNQSGNVWELTADGYSDRAYLHYKEGKSMDWGVGSYVAHRGGGFGSDAANCRAANRFLSEIDKRYRYEGFRPALSPVEGLEPAATYEPANPGGRTVPLETQPRFSATHNLEPRHPADSKIKTFQFSAIQINEDPSSSSGFTMSIGELKFMLSRWRVESLLDDLRQWNEYCNRSIRVPFTVVFNRGSEPGAYCEFAYDMQGENKLLQSLLDARGKMRRGR